MAPGTEFEFCAGTVCALHHGAISVAAGCVQVCHYFGDSSGMGSGLGVGRLSCGSTELPGLQGECEVGSPMDLERGLCEGPARAVVLSLAACSQDASLCKVTASMGDRRPLHCHGACV